MEREMCEHGVGQKVDMGMGRQERNSVSNESNNDETARYGKIWHAMQ